MKGIREEDLPVAETSARGREMKRARRHAVTDGIQ